MKNPGVSTLLALNIVTVSLDVNSVAVAYVVSDSMVLQEAASAFIYIQNVWVHYCSLLKNTYLFVKLIIAEYFWTCRITAIILSRFILDLRSVYSTAGDPGNTTMSKSISLKFVASVEGNMGAPLSDAWVTGREIDDEVRYSDNPLSVWLVEFRGDQQICA